MKKSNYIFIAVSIIIALGLAACIYFFVYKSDDNQEVEEDKKAVEETVNWVEYPTAEFSVDYPSNWSVRDDRSKELITFESPLKGDGDNFKEYFATIYLGSTEKNGGSAEGYIKDTLLNNVKDDKSVVSVGDVEKLAIETNDTVNKVYPEVRRVRLRCKLTNYDRYAAYDEKQEVPTEVSTEDNTADETDNINDISETDTINGLSEVMVEELNASAEPNVDTTEIEERPVDSTEGADNSDSNSSGTVYRDYIVIDNGGELYAFISSMKDNEVDYYAPIFERALKSFNCTFGTSLAKSTERENAKTKVNPEVIEGTSEGETIVAIEELERAMEEQSGE